MWKQSQYLSPFLLGRQLSVPNFEKGAPEKNECLGGLQDFLPQISAWGSYYVSCLKRNICKTKWLCKIKYGFEGSILIVDLGLC